MFEKLCKISNGDFKVRNLWKIIRKTWSIPEVHIMGITYLYLVCVIFLKYMIDDGITDAFIMLVKISIFTIISCLFIFISYKILTSKIAKKIHNKMMNITLIKCKKVN